MIIKQLSVFLENKKGRLNAAAKVLADHGINIRALSLADTSEFGVLRMIVDKPEEGKNLLRQSGVFVNVTNVLAVAIEDRPGGALSVLDLLEKGDINMEYMYACDARVGQMTDKAVMVVQVSDLARAEKILQENGYSNVDPFDIYPA